MCFYMFTCFLILERISLFLPTRVSLSFLRFKPNGGPLLVVYGLIKITVNVTALLISKGKLLIQFWIYYIVFSQVCASCNHLKSNLNLNFNQNWNYNCECL
jgi:hypothetical protein